MYNNRSQMFGRPETFRFYNNDALFRDPEKDRRDYFLRESEQFYIEHHKPSYSERVNSLPNKTRDYSEIFNVKKVEYKPLRRRLPQSLSQTQSDIFFTKCHYKENNNNNNNNIRNNFRDLIENKNNKQFNRNNSCTTNIKSTLNDNYNSKKKKLNSRNSVVEYNPDPYYDNKTSFQRKMADLYHGHDSLFQKFGNKDMQSSKGFMVKEDYYNPEKTNDYMRFMKRNHLKQKTNFYDTTNKYDPKKSAKDNYNRTFVSSVILMDDKDVEDKIKKFEERKQKEKEEKSKCQRIKNSKIMIFNQKKANKMKNNENKQWIAGLNWYDNTEIIFKNNRNKSMTASDRKFQDQVDSLISYGYHPADNPLYKNRPGKISLEKEERNYEYKKYEPKNNIDLPTYRKKGIKNSSSDFNDEHFYENNYKLKELAPNEIKNSEFIIKNCGNLDKAELEQRLCQKGIHIHDIVEETRSILNFKDKDIKFKIREHKGCFTQDKIKEIEKELKQKNHRISLNEIKPRNNKKIVNSDIYKPSLMNSTMIKNNKNTKNIINWNSKETTARDYGRNANFTKSFNNVKNDYKSSAFLRKK